jgi:hypothetical protein
MQISPKLAALAILSITLVASTHDLAAADARRFVAKNAGAICQPALPSGVGSNIRIRPLALQNEGTANAFVSCNFDGGSSLFSPRTQSVSLGLLNRTGVDVNITCTLVNGLDTGTAIDAEYVPRTTQVEAHSGSLVEFVVADLNGTPDAIHSPNISCMLPAGTGIGRVQHSYIITLED